MMYGQPMPAQPNSVGGGFDRPEMVVAHASEPNVRVAMEYLEKAVSEADDLAGRLISAIQPVLRSCGPEMANDAKVSGVSPPEHSEIAVVIFRAAERLRNVSRQLTSVVHRIDI